ncbi:fungal-specific transcription factor domain-containing protein [Apiospora kogelbergensis]|uniref:Fungal-specific transcription factor domain-containing protein n=1 Tax=Apiospora kogelbergensis TaxID=1337665 RepID=A0AAW0R5X8_9PEZI
MAKRLQEAEEALARIQARECTSSAEETSSQPSPSPQPDLLLAESSIGPEFSHGSALAERMIMGSSTMVTAAEPSGSPTLDKSGNIPSATCRGAPKKIVLSELSLDKNGEIRYYGPTSAVHDPPCPQSGKVRPSLPAPNDASRAETRSTLAALVEGSSVWEEFGLENASKRTGIPRKVITELLNLYFTWVSPMFMYVYRPGDMATGGGYYSELLLTVICAHAAKYQCESYADSLLARARHLLGAAIQLPSSVPTVQALLQLSARELAGGLISQAWVYSGIAFRMASDLGLQVDSPSIKGLGPVDREIRLRLFWSCYFWDKATSLYAGRPPAVMEELPDSTLYLLDDSTDLETWNPCYGNTMNLTKLAYGEYPPVNSHAVSCFANSCKLSMIINEIILQLYSRRGRAITEITLNNIKMRLDLWRTQSPNHLRYDPDGLPPIAPPPHIMAQNLLYFATVILAHRPYWSIPKYFSICLAAAQSIEKLVLCFEATFGLERITYLIGYCIYTGASAALEDAKNSTLGAAHPVLRTLLRALNKGMQRCPLLERSLEIIIKGLNHTPPVHQAARVVNSEAGGRVASPGSAGGLQAVVVTWAPLRLRLLRQVTDGYTRTRIYLRSHTLIL